MEKPLKLCLQCFEQNIVCSVGSLKAYRFVKPNLLLSRRLVGATPKEMVVLQYRNSRDQGVKVLLEGAVIHI
jgi:hypothetical protein